MEQNMWSDIFVLVCLFSLNAHKPETLWFIDSLRLNVPEILWILIFSRVQMKLDEQMLQFLRHTLNNSPYSCWIGLFSALWNAEICCCIMQICSRSLEPAVMVSGPAAAARRQNTASKANQLIWFQSKSGSTRGPEHVWGKQIWCLLLWFHSVGCVVQFVTTCFGVTLLHCDWLKREMLFV